MDERGVRSGARDRRRRPVVASTLEHDAFSPASRLDLGSGGSEPQVAVSERHDIAAAWLFGAGQVAGRFRDEDGSVGPQTLLSTPDFGAVAPGTLRIASDRAGDNAVAMLQGDPGARRLTAAVYDRPPGAPFIYSSTRFQKRKRPELKWRGGLDLWGTPTFNVMVDGALAGSSSTPSYQVVNPLKEGPHRLRIVQVDRRGQTALSRERFIRVDTAVPRITMRVSGKRRRGSTLKISARASDGKGSGLAVRRDRLRRQVAARAGETRRRIAIAPGASRSRSRPSTRWATWPGARSSCGSRRSDRPAAAGAHA